MRNMVLKLKLAVRVHSSCLIKEANESMTRVDSTVPSITDPDPDHPKGMHPYNRYNVAFIRPHEHEFVN